MTNAIATPQAGLDIVTDSQTRLGPVLIASDGSAAAAAALRAGAAFANASGAPVTVLSVLEPLPLVAADYGLLLPPAEADAGRREALTRSVQEQVREVAGDRAEWKVVVRDGDPAATIARVARELDARLIVLGLGHHDILDRIFGGETALHALRLTHRPVFAVAPDFTALPKRVAMGVDFSEQSLKAAREALALLGDVSMIYLVHVAPRIEMQPETYAMWMANYGEGVGPAFERFQSRLDVPPGATVESITVTGKPSRALLEFAKSAHVDVIVTGSRGAGFVDRILVGSTATGIIRGANCSVLAVPSPSTARRHEEGAEGVPELEWASALDAFTRRNAGRIASLEVDDPEIGAQAQQHDYPFLGATYDHHDRRVELMLGDMEGGARHLTRGIGNVQRLDILKDEMGRDLVLRVSHGSGQTILTLVR
jgi:nucleotide-binding universal stress UspA family protein